MTSIDEILNDLNITIADVETIRDIVTQVEYNTPSLADHHRPHLTRAIGQLKAARASLLCTMKQEVSK